jgi:hypothetical protein
MFFEREKALKRNVATRQPARDVSPHFLLIVCPIFQEPIDYKKFWYEQN